MAEQPEAPPDAAKPLSLREDAPRPLVPQSVSNTPPTVILVMTAAIFLLLGLLVATLLGGSSVDKETVRQIVGTQVAAQGPVGVNPDGSANQAQVQQMIDQAVSTQVAALIPTSTPIPPTPTRIPNPVADDGDPYVGPKDAPVVIVEFADFQCGFCDKFYNETLPVIRQTYPEQVKFVYRDFPIFGEPSAQAAMAAECANEQGKFWDMHDMLFSKLHNAEVAFEISQDSLISLASDIGLDADSFTQCMTSQRYLDEIIKDYQTAQAYGLRGTPGFVINGVVYTFGAQPFDVFDQIIKSELARAISEGDTSAPASTGS